MFSSVKVFQKQHFLNEKRWEKNRNLVYDKRPLGKPRLDADPLSSECSVHS